jgi:signal peptidase I
MERQRRQCSKPSTSSQPDEARNEQKARVRRNRRESIESFVVVFVAFLLWSFEAEGFVIPTGSMAPSLMGRHKEIVCPQCGYVYTVNADSEVDSNGSGTATGIRVTWGTCENCRFESRVDDAPSASGDRIYTMKKGLEIPFLPAVGRVGPKRWEVVVFKLPEEPEVRYIKRLVGMPNEILRIHQGDLWRRPRDESQPFQRLRRPTEHQQAMQVIVYDDSHRAMATRDDPRWRRWTPVSEGWSEPAAGSYRPASDRRGWTELRYRHVVPDPEQWHAMANGQELRVAPRPTLITDFSSYNTDLSPQGKQYPQTAARPWFQPHWVGDLTLSCRVNVTRQAGRLRLELIKGGRSNRCEIDLATGLAQLFHGDHALGAAAATPLAGAGSYELVLANVDDRLTLWVDDALPFGEGRVFESAEQEGLCVPAVADLEPARLAAQEADLSVSELVLKRDIYYTLHPSHADLDDLQNIAFSGPHAFFDVLADPARYAALTWATPNEYALGEGRYLMLGDNSPWSRDGRAWGRTDQKSRDDPGQGWDDSGRERWEVPESLIIGKAFWVYWPHAKPVWPMIRLGADYRFPVRPYFEQVRWIR